jgi:preprotein translocase subunit YajC
MCKEPTFDQLRMVMELKEGDKVKLNNGDIAEFVKAKQKKFIGIINNKRYDIPFSMLVEITEKIDQNKKKEENNNVMSQLKKGDWFYINKSGNALVFKFDGIEGKRIIGINPIGNTRTKIDMNFEIGILKF